MKKYSMNRFSSEDLSREGKNLIEEFDPSRLSYPDREGRWRVDPASMRDCVSNEIFFYIWKLAEEKRTAFFQDALFPFTGDQYWSMAQKIFSHLQNENKKSPNLFLIILEILGWVIAYEAFRLNSELPVPRWDRWAKEEQERCEKRRKEMADLIEKLSENAEEAQFLTHIETHLRKTCPEFFALLATTIAEEHRINQKIRSLLKKAENRENREEILPLVTETILPPMGIVTETSPALLRPCLRLLMDEKIEIDSGIPYNASVILSILQDRRSVETLLKAIRHYPLHYCKIRENLIYTLGNLKAKKAVEFLIQVLDTLHEGEPNIPITQQQEEAIVALGKIGLESLPALPSLIKFVEHPFPVLQTYLAWAMGEIGKSQKEKFGGVSADTIISLLKLLQVKDKKVFEQSVDSLKKIEMPEFIHTLYLYNVGAVNILGLKPAQKGLYELSETIHFLIRKKGRAIIAVNGDSGTGKTYFCQSLMNGFENIQKNEILYLMRDRKKDQTILNQILGIEWLKNHIDPIYYHDYPLSEEDDNPEEFFPRFLEENEDKKLIILDGCRDKYYFQRIIDLFYFRGKLDVEVNFRATTSTRRKNLEEREMALESVRTHLSFLEEPALEDTFIYREGNAILYDLDNSVPYRLAREEIQELFSQVRIESWGELIRVGEFKKETHPLKVSTGKIKTRSEPFALKKVAIENVRHEPLFHEERKFRMVLNQDISKNPHLIGTIDADDLKAKQIRFYAQDQIAGWGEEGRIFILTFLDNRIFSTQIQKCRDISLLGRRIFAIEQEGECVLVNFEKKEKTRFPKADSRALVSSAISTDRLLTGHQDGSIRVWDFVDGSIQVMQGTDKPILALASDYAGRIYSACSVDTLRIWDIGNSVVNIIDGVKGAISNIKAYQNRKILTVIEKPIHSEKPKTKQTHLAVWDLDNQRFFSCPSPSHNILSGICINHDMRILAAYKTTDEKKGGGLALISPGLNSSTFQVLEGHGKQTRDCLIMGPKIITCGTETDGRHTIRIWGSDHYVRNELQKLFAIADIK